MITNLNISNFGQSVIICPHDDDGAIGCGGIIYMLKQKPIVIITTDGSLGYVEAEKAKDIVNIRKQEALLAYYHLGVPKENIVFLEYPDMSLRNYQCWKSNNGTEGGYQRIFKILRKYQPNTVILPYKDDLHIDHKIAFDIAWNGLERARKNRMLDFGPPIPLNQVLMYQVWGHISETSKISEYKLNEKAKWAKTESIKLFK